MNSRQLETSFAKFDGILKITVAQVKKAVLETKQTKFIRDQTDYNSNTVYTWKKADNRSRRQSRGRSRNRRNGSRNRNTNNDQGAVHNTETKRVTYSDTDFESGDDNGASSGDEPPRSILKNTKQNSSQQAVCEATGSGHHQIQAVTPKTKLAEPKGSSTKYVDNSTTVPQTVISDDDQRQIEQVFRLPPQRTGIGQTADKGGSVVVLNKTDYVNEALRQLNNVEDYIPLDRDPTTTFKKDLLDILDDGLEEGHYDQKTFEFLVVDHPVVPIFHHLPKVHKSLTEVRGRPIVNGINSLLEHVSQWVDSILQPLVKNLHSYIQDTKDVIMILDKLKWNSACYKWATIDVVALYSSIPHEEGLTAYVGLTTTEVKVRIRNHLSTIQADFPVEPSPPYASSFGTHNITLKWPVTNVTVTAFIIQWKYVHIPGAWEYTQTVTDSVYTVNGLQPYTEYWFRVVWILCHLEFYSPPSLVYRTLAYGAPASVPRIETLQSSSYDTIEVIWIPPLFSNGPIIGYNLILSADKENQRHHSETRRHSFQFYNTKPNSTYRFSITAVNAEGEGPAAEANITTAASTVPDKNLWLFLSRNSTLKKREKLKEPFDESHCLPAQSEITAISINVYTEEIFFSERNYIWVKGATNITDTSNLRIYFTGLGAITSISVDWLFNKMYFVMDKQVYTCDLNNCSDVKMVTLNSTFSPHKLVADPYNGYLFLLMDNGIHRIVLPETSIQENVLKTVVHSRTIQDFMINFQSKRLVYVNNVDRGLFSIVSAFLDGSDAHDLREIRDDTIKEIKSFLFFGDTVLFTDGNIVYYEEFNMDKYWYNEYIVACDIAAPTLSGYNNINLYGESVQPFPLPSEPQQVLVLFGTECATVLWKPPKTTLESSITSWQKWTYTVNISSQQAAIMYVFTNITSTEITVKELNKSTKYEITVQASSPAGASLSTLPITGTTLHSGDEERYFLAIGTNGLWKQPLDRFGPGTFLSDKPRLASDLDWYNSTLYWSNETGQVNMWDMRDTVGFNISHIPGIHRAGALAFDWLGQVIYWSDKTDSKIYRKSLSTLDSETVTAARYLVTDLVLDSVNAFLYWCTDYTVESSRLNGQRHLTFYSVKPLSSTQVVALTVDIRYGLLYWLVKDGLNINMYNAVFRKDGFNETIVTKFPFWSSSEISQNALIFHSDRLYWINGNKHITVQEVNQSHSTPFSQPAEFACFTLAVSSNKPLPVNFTSIPNVVPDFIPSSSIEVRGNYSKFHIIWKAPLNVEYGTIYYCVKSKLLQQRVGAVEDICLTPEDYPDTFYEVVDLEPYAEFDFAVTPYTYWGRGPTTSLTLRAPEGVPSEPLNLRAFLLQTNSVFDKEKSVVEMRWDNPMKPNGDLIMFTVYYRVVNATLHAWTIINISAPLTSFQLYDLSPGLRLDFQVKASTSVGSGPLSDIYQTNISAIYPSPAVITVSAQQITLIDTDRKEAMWHFSTDNTVNVVSYTAFDGNLFYILNDLLWYRHLENQSSQLILKDNRLSNSRSMTIDWIARHIYVNTQSQQNGTQIFVIDLEQKKKDLKLINAFQTDSDSTIEVITVYPLISRLYWLESWNTGNRIWYYNILNGTVKPVVGYETKTNDNTNSCDCVLNHAELGTVMTLDTTDSTNPNIYFLCNNTDVWLADLEGCHCLKLITLPLISEWVFSLTHFYNCNQTRPGKYLAPDNDDMIAKRNPVSIDKNSVLYYPEIAKSAIITSLAVDDSFIYWSITDKTNGSVYQARKLNNIPTLLQNHTGHIQVIAYGTALQPFPDVKCLLLAINNSLPKIQSATNTSFTLELPPTVPKNTCPIAMTTPTYRIKYKKCIVLDSAAADCTYDGSTILSIECQEPIVLVPDLQPYTTYEMKITVENYYSVLFSQRPTEVVITGQTKYGEVECPVLHTMAMQMEEVYTVFHDLLSDFENKMLNRFDRLLSLMQYTKVVVEPTVPKTSHITTWSTHQKESNLYDEQPISEDDYASILAKFVSFHLTPIKHKKQSINIAMKVNYIISEWISISIEVGQLPPTHKQKDGVSSSQLLRVVRNNTNNTRKILQLDEMSMKFLNRGYPHSLIFQQFPGAVEDIFVRVLSNTLVNVTWSEPLQPNGPLEAIRYQVKANDSRLIPVSPLRKSEFPKGLTLIFTDLNSGTHYQFTVLAFHPDENWSTASHAVHTTTFNAPAVPDSIIPGNRSLSLQWRAPSETFRNFWFELKKVKESDWILPVNKSCKSESIYICILTGVNPNTDYYVRAVVIFVTEAEGISDQARFKTTAGVPSKPGVPQNLAEDQNSIRWDVAEDNGSNLTYNILQYRKVLLDGRGDVSPWLVAYNGSCINICLWISKELEGTFQFRSASANMLGLGDYSEISDYIKLIKENTNYAMETIIIVTTLLAILLVILLTVAFVWYRRSNHKHKNDTDTAVMIQEDKELAALRGLYNAVGLANACYAISTLPTPAEMEKLPRFPREKLSLSVFLGSGAFGEVYEGSAVDILGPQTGTTNVAVKTLKKDATDHEKAEFLKEAFLMSQFNHPNILKLLGVCLLNDPQYIILELMAGGDLLSYLRGARANTSLQSPLLSTLDLLDISENISRGCAYLEKMHFVHRDLAARNCLVSVKEYDNLSRIIKIGDFGLARDVYKYDYYKKKGEGFLPVRWMAPESLVDGVFNSCADVWSFGVLLWEVFTLGQQPYPGYSNIEVLHYVRSGQRMDSPANCPDDMWDLILKCWAQDPKQRPRFSFLKKKLEQLKSSSLRCTRFTEKRMTLDGVDNPAFKETEGTGTSSSKQGVSSLTLTEKRNAEGLNYLFVAT
ncbi:proto-oncogene tyrosine-protein kinase ROS [Bombina bombina]|uniref:proto-oncogene tyrosine-protein kinase ROS n=1 Tax=Bombina bombina TaxID=8345 RepID=UPI00235A5675|nr:proto-oncogene tyrosine-protein kinase ROS [Bombina bombina]